MSKLPHPKVLKTLAKMKSEITINPTEISKALKKALKEEGLEKYLKKDTR